MENNFNENLFQAIDTIIAKRLEEVVFDETIQCSIVGKTSTKGNEYEVKNNSVIFKAIAKDGEEYKEGDNVCVSILANSNERIILGRYTLEQEDALSYTDPFDKFVMDKKIPLISNEKPKSVIKLTNGQEISCEDIELSLDDNQPSSLSGYDFMGLEFGIKVSGLSEVTKGDWAIGITLLDDEKNPLHDMYKYGPNEQYEISPYVLSSDEIYGNPYALTSNFIQRKLFYFPNSLQLSKIHQIKISIYQSGGFTFDSEATLTIENFQMAFGYDVNKYLDKPIHLYVEGEYNGIYTYLDADHVGMKNKSRPDIKALLIDQKNKKILTELPKGWSIRWYKYKINEPGDEYGGGYWDYFEKVDGLTLSATQYTLDINRPNTQIKAVLCEDKPSVNLNLEAAETIVFDDRRTQDTFNINDLSEADQGQYIIYKDENKVIRLAKYNAGENGWSSEALDNELLDDDQQLLDENWLKAYYYGSALSLGTIAAVIHLAEDTNLQSEAPINYYQYISESEGIWQSIDLGETEKIVIATSVPFIFENNITNIENGRNTQIRIEAERIHWPVYNNGFVTEKKPIRLTVKHNVDTEADWKPKTLNWFLIGEGQIEGISLSDNAEDDDIEKQLQVTLGDDGEAPNTTIYCYLKKNLTVSAAASINNTIRCIADGIDVAEIQLSFADRSTQGTGYSFTIQPDKKYIVNNEGDFCIFTPKLTTSDGIELDISQYNIQWGWDQQNFAKEHMVISSEENSRAKITLQETFKNDEYNVYIIQASCVVNALQKKGTQDVTETITLIARYPIAITNYLDDEDIIVKGIFELQWDNQQNLLTKLEDESNNYTIQVRKDDGILESLEATWNLNTFNNKDFQYKIEKNKLTRKVNANDLFTNQSPVCITCTYTNGENEKIIVWQQPLVFSISQYDYDLTNKWAGGAVTINDKEATVMATAFGAGTKDTKTNTFTGILMGSFAQNNDDGKTVNGLYGFKNGISTFGIDAKTGDAYFRGHLVASSGDIGGWTIAPFDNSNGMDTYETGLYTQRWLDTNKTKYIQFGLKNSTVANNFAIYCVRFNKDGIKDGDDADIFGIQHDGTAIFSRVYINNRFNTENMSITGTTGVRVPITSFQSSLILGSAAQGPTEIVTWFDNYDTDDNDNTKNYNKRAFYGYILQNKAQYDWSTTASDEITGKLYVGYSIPKIEYVVGSTTYPGYGWYADSNKYNLKGHQFNIMATNVSNGLCISCINKTAKHLVPNETGVGATTLSYSEEIAPARITLFAGPWRTEDANGARIILESYADSDGNVQQNSSIRLRTYTYEKKHAMIDKANIQDDDRDNLIIKGSTGRLNGTWYLGSGSTAVTSDRSKKYDICSLLNSYNNLFDLLRPIRYKYNNGMSDRYHTGFIAQEVEQAIKDAGLTNKDFAALVIDEDTGTYYLRYEEFIALCVSEIQKLKTEFKELKEKKE